MIPQPSTAPFSKSLQWALGIYLVCFLIIFFTLKLNYRLDEVDDTWWVSFAYNYLHHHTTSDVIGGTDVVSSGVQHFGKTYVFLIGSFLNFFGWTKTNGYLLSLIFMIAGLGTWYFTLRRFQYSQELCAAFCVVGLLLDPYFSAIVSDRTESFVFLISSLSLLLFVHDRYFEAAALSWVGLETHPIGAVAYFLMGAAFWARRSTVLSAPPRLSRLLARGGAGFVVGFLYYLLLHPHGLLQLPRGLLSSNQLHNEPVQNFLFDYYFHSKYNRHWAELAFMVFCAWKFFKTGVFKKDPFVIPLFISLFLFSLIFRRPQYHYVLYFYPAFLLLAVSVFESRWKLQWMVWGFLAYLIPQYAFAYHITHRYDYNLKIREYRSIIPANSLPLLGDADAWFAFPGRDFYFNRYWGNIRGLKLDRFYLIRDKDYRHKHDETTAYIQKHFVPKTIGKFSMNGSDYTITLEKPNARVRP